MEHTKTVNLSRTIDSSGVLVTPLRYRDIFIFARLRSRIESEAKHLVPKRGERKESPLYVFARMLLQRGRMRTLLLKIQGEIVGYVTLIFAKFEKLQDNAYLTISIRASYRGKGYGTFLMREAEALARSRATRRIELEVFGKNTRAIELYKRLGYEIEGIRRRAVRDGNIYDDIVFMAKFLN